MPESAGESETAGERYSVLTTGATQVREAVKWLVTLVGAVGSVLIAGISLSNIGKATDTFRIALSVVGAAIAFIGLAAVIGLLLKAMLPSSKTLLDADGNFAKEHQEVFRGFANDGPSLQQEYVRALEMRAEAIRGNTRMPPTVSDWEAKAIDTRVKAMSGAVQDTLRLRSYVALEERMSGARLFAVLGGLLAAAVGLGILVYASNPPDTTPETVTTPPATVSASSMVGARLIRDNLHGANLAGADMHGSNLTGAKLIGANLAGADLRNAKLDDADLTNASLEGADLLGATLEGVTWANTVCPDGELASVGESCDRHLET